jgi:hypothetical protein
MRIMFLAAAIAVALFINIHSSQATEGPWCASMSVGAGTEVQDCSMRSLEMCRREVIAGNRGSCYPNPRSPDAALWNMRGVETWISPAWRARTSRPWPTSRFRPQ